MRSRSRSRDSSSSQGSCDSLGSVEGVLRAASDSEEDAMEEAAQHVGASNASAMAAIAAPRSEPLATADDSQSEGEDGDASSNSGSDVDAEPVVSEDAKKKTLVSDLLNQLITEPADA